MIRFRSIAAAACLLIAASIGLVTPATAADHPGELSWCAHRSMASPAGMAGEPGAPRRL